MHLTTLVSLLAVGAVAAPAKRSLDLNTRMTKPTLSDLDLASPTGSFAGLNKAPEVTGLARRQEDAGEEEETSSSSSSSSAAGLIPELPSIPLLRRQEPEPTGEPSADPLSAYLNTLDGEGEYDEKAAEEALDRYHKSLEEDKSNSTTSAVTTSTSATVAPATVAPVSEPANSTDSEQQ